MKSLGLIGGTSWYSTIDYYRYINKMVNDKLGGNNNPPLILYNMNQEKIHEFQKVDQWDRIIEMTIEAGNKLKAAGIEGLMFCANTPHKIYDAVKTELNIPMLHIADATAKGIKEKKLNKVGIIGTIYTMEGDFITGKLKKEYDIDVVVPEKKSREYLNKVVFEELSFGNFSDPIKKSVIKEINQLKSQGAQGIILGCTEFPILVKQNDIDIPAFDTTLLHAQMAVDFILS